jgi:hypothetical protein
MEHSIVSFIALECIVLFFYNAFQKGYSLFVRLYSFILVVSELVLAMQATFIVSLSRKAILKRA